MIALLAHLDATHYRWSPRPVTSGFDSEGNELLTFIEGESPQPLPWTDEAISQIGSMLRDLHDATASFVPPPDALWMDWSGRHLGDPTLGIGHGDLGPWNIMAVDNLPTGFIDWDTAGPIDPVWEVAQVAWLNAQLHDDDIAERLGLGDVAHRAHQLSLLLDGYRLSRVDRVGFVDKMIEFAVHSARNEAIEHKVTPDTTTGIADSGYPFVWGLTWRIRSASWMLRNRTVLEIAIS